MKKICFNEKYLLHQKVLDGTKTMTRRNVTLPKTFHHKEVRGFYKYMNTENGLWYTVLYDEDEREIEGSSLKPLYEIGETVAIAQRYKDIWNLSAIDIDCGYRYLKDGSTVHFNVAGVDNKMFVKPDLMPHHIKITDVRLERLQSISDEDCIKEGITPVKQNGCSTLRGYIPDRKLGNYGDAFPDVRSAYAELMDRLSGKGTWDSNPWVWVYEFELVD